MNIGVYLCELMSFFFLFSEYTPKEWNCWRVEIYLTRASILTEHFSNWHLNLYASKMFLSAICKFPKQHVTLKKATPSIQYPLGVSTMHYISSLIFTVSLKVGYYFSHALKQEPETVRLSSLKYQVFNYNRSSQGCELTSVSEFASFLLFHSVDVCTHTVYFSAQILETSHWALL